MRNRRFVDGSQAVLFVAINRGVHAAEEAAVLADGADGDELDAAGGGGYGKLVTGFEVESLPDVFRQLYFELFGEGDGAHGCVGW